MEYREKQIIAAALGFMMANLEEVNAALAYENPDTFEDSDTLICLDTEVVDKFNIKEIESLCEKLDSVLSDK
jgi:hypothetical protein